MKKIIAIITLLMLWASPIMAQQAGGSKAGESKPGEGDVLESRIGLGWYGINQRGNTRAFEYYNPDDSPAGAVHFEWDPLPHRFVFDSYYLNSKDYFGELDYSYRDVLLLNGYVRDLFHNLDHYSFGLDDPTTNPSPSFTDLNPGDTYGIDNRLSRGFVRLKTPDFAFHLYADARTVDREGTIQQRFLSTLTGGLDKISRSRDIDWKTSEYRVGLNSHLGPIEADYSHAEKKFEAETGKVLYEVPGSGPAIPHNLISDLKSSSDTVKLHTTYSGKVVVSGTYSTGDRKNEDSGAKVDFTNAAGDLMIMPITSLILTVKYRHFENDVTNPDTVDNITVSGVQPVNVRDSISSKRDVVSSVLRYRASSSLTLRAEFQSDTTDRTQEAFGSSIIISGPTVTGPAYWWVPESTTKNTVKLGLSYRLLKKMLFRADYSQTSIDNPAYAIDPDKAQAARATLSWMPATWLNTMLSYGMIREKRDELGGPLGGGSRDAARDQGLASATMMIGNRSSLTASYGLYKNKVDQTITLTEGTGGLALEPAVPYEDTANVGSLVLTVAPRDGVTVVGSATKSYSRGEFRLAGAGTATNVSGIAELSDLKIIDTVYEAGLEMEHSEYVSSEVRYQYRRYDDEIDNTQDGVMKLILATVSVKW